MISFKKKKLTHRVATNKLITLDYHPETKQVSQQNNVFKQ